MTSRFSGYLSYANQLGVGQGPITGGLFLGSDAINGLSDTSRFPVSQDQRNTAGARVRFQENSRVWVAVGESTAADCRQTPMEPIRVFCWPNTARPF